MSVYAIPRFTGRLLKPSQLATPTRKLARRRQRASEDRKVRLRELDAARTQRLAIYQRDHGRCRAFGTPLDFVSTNVLKQAHIHHVCFRSAGGDASPANLCTLSPLAHDGIHQHLLTCEGSGEDTLTFTQYDRRGDVLRVWESRNPSAPKETP